MLRQIPITPHDNYIPGVLEEIPGAHLADEERDDAERI